jgi:CubicO group peptidase (beta-lactamase class C family)
MIRVGFSIVPLRRWAVVDIVAGLCAGVRIQAADNLVLSRFGDYIEALRMQTAVPGLAALIVGTTDVAWERAFGHQDVDRLVTTRTDTPFHFDMITQTLTASLTLQCVQAGKVSLDDRIEKSRLRQFEWNATIRQS